MRYSVGHAMIYLTLIYYFFIHRTVRAAAACVRHHMLDASHYYWFETTLPIKIYFDLFQFLQIYMDFCEYIFNLYLIYFDSTRGSSAAVRQCGSARRCAAVCCVRHCARRCAVLCGCVWQCAWMCVAMREAKCRAKCCTTGGNVAVRTVAVMCASALGSV